MFRPGLVAALAWVFCVAASAQTPNPILQHYRAYEAALDAGDLATAEREAAAALAASEAQDGDGGRTAILALNLATVRLIVSDAAGAIEPGRRALALAQAQGEDESGVSPAFAQLIVARAELAARERGAAQRLAQALETAQQAQIESAELYDGARDLAVWTLRNERYAESARAWEIAAIHAEGSRLAPNLARGLALTGGAAALILGEVEGRERRINRDVSQEAHGMLTEALNLIGPIAGEPTNGQVTPVQRSYAEALAWRAVLVSKMRSDGRRLPEVREAQGDGADGMNEIDVPAYAAGRPRCHLDIRITGDASRLYPEQANLANRLGGVAVLFRTDEAGEIVEVRALATVGGTDFGDAVEGRNRWRAVRRDDSPPNCRMAMSVIRSVSFSIGGL